MPGPWRPRPATVRVAQNSKFQSQPRCQAPGDSYTAVVMSESCDFFNLTRNAKPLATPLRFFHSRFSLCFSITREMPGPGRQLQPIFSDSEWDFSISTEMPGPWRQVQPIFADSEWDVSISTEMPGPWRP